MHPLINERTVETIRATGHTKENLPDRIGILEQHALPYDKEAENVIISGCQIPGLLPNALASLGRVFDRHGLSYTFLSREYCCGNYLYRPAIKAKDEAALNECRELSKEFIAHNIKNAERVGAKRLIVFCSPCYPLYKHAFPEENIVFYPAAIEEVMQPVQFKNEIDYYAGCYRLHRKFAPMPMDLESTEALFSKIHGLDINRISAPKCCFSQEGLAHMLDNVRTRLMVHICSGCYLQAKENISQEAPPEVLMLPDFVEMVYEEA